jgi:hypothetical protein
MMFLWSRYRIVVIPAKAGIHLDLSLESKSIPAFARMTSEETGAHR